MIILSLKLIMRHEGMNKQPRIRLLKPRMIVVAMKKFIACQNQQHKPLHCYSIRVLLIKLSWSTSLCAKLMSGMCPHKLDL